MGPGPLPGCRTTTPSVAMVAGAEVMRCEGRLACQHSCQAGAWSAVAQWHCLLHGQVLVLAYGSSLASLHLFHSHSAVDREIM